MKRTLSALCIVLLVASAAGFAHEKHKRTLEDKQACSPASLTEHRQIRDGIDRVLRLLDPREERIVRMRFIRRTASSVSPLGTATPCLRARVSATTKLAVLNDMDVPPMSGLE